MPRTETFRRLTAIILTVTLSLLGLASCGTNAPGKPTAEPGTIISETETEICIVDQAGREVTVGKYPDSIALCYRVVIRFLLSLELGDRIMGIGKTEEFLEEIQPSLKDCADVGQGVADIEALAELNPDVFFHKASDVETLEAVEKIGIPAVGIDIETADDMMTALKIIGAVCGKSDRAEQLIDYYEKELDYVDDLTSGIEDKRTAVVMGSSAGKVADGSMLQGEMLERAGGMNCASDIEASELWPTAGTEQIFSWNPDYIFITNSQSARYNAEDLYNDPAWSELSAIKNKNVYVMPAERDSWELPGIVSVLGTEYMIHIMYPELMSDAELSDKVSELYELMYGISPDRDYLGY